MSWMCAEAIRASNGPPGARFKMPNNRTEASTSVTPISMLRRTRKRVISSDQWPVVSGQLGQILPTTEHRPLTTSASAQIPLPDVPVVAVGSVLGLPVGELVARGCYVRAEEERQGRQLISHKKLKRIHGRTACTRHQRASLRTDQRVGCRVLPTRVVLAS